MRKLACSVGTIITAMVGALPALAMASTGLEMVETASSKIRNIDTPALVETLSKRPDTVLIDVRTPSEIHLLGGTIESPRNINIPRGWLEVRIADEVPDKDWPIVVYCGINQRLSLIHI